MKKEPVSTSERNGEKKEKTGMGPVRRVPLTNMRKTIIKRLTYSEKNTLRVTMTNEVDMSEAKRRRETVNQDMSSVRISYTDMIVKATVEALKHHPLLNSKLEGETVQLFEKIHMGVAVALESGLIVPVIRNADELTLEDVARTMQQLIEKAKNGKLSLREVTGGTFTITNLGHLGVDVFTPIINPPQSAILAVGEIKEKPRVVNGEIMKRHVMSISLSFDHRIIDGAEAAQFLQELKTILQTK
ncbi:MAG: dihydrolipoamide acetyltransferase family protein [Candidatus Hermodarchaeia archaeon]